ncbi:hypothetical protein AAHC03_0533 [Spirometra sp. Aus1]
MGRGTYFHALILPVSCYAGEIEKSASTDRQWRRKGRIEALYNSDDLARHMANHVMNQNPALSVTHICTPDLIPQGLWRDPYKIYATLFSQASRVLFLVTESDQDEFEDFFVNHLLHLFKRLQGHRSFSEWNTRFIVVVMGEFELPAVLCCENPPCEVVRFREIGWFRDSIALMLLYQKIKDYWVPPSQKEDLDQRILPHNTFEQPRRDFCIELEETETTTTSITIKNSVSSMIDDRQESVVRELIREVGEPSDYSECQSQSSSPLADMDYEKTDQLDESSDKKQLHFLLQQTFNMLIEKENTKQYKINDYAADFPCTFCRNVKKCKTRSLETSKSETQLYGKETLWSNDDESKRTSEETNWRSTSYAGFTESDERTEPFETPKSSPSNPKTPDTCECRDLQPQFPHLDDQATDLDPNYRGVEVTPTYSAISDKERAPENTEDSEPTDAMNTFALDNLSPLHGHGPTVPLSAEQSGYCLPPDKSATDMENSRYSSHNTKDIGQNGNAVLLDKGDILPGEQLDSEVTEAFQAISKYPDPINEGMSPVPIQKRGSATESPASNQISETSGKGALKGPTPTGSPCFERHLGHEPSGNTTDEFLASMEFTVTDTATRTAETGPACSTVHETPRSYSQNAEDDSLIGHEKVEHDHSAGSSVHTSKHIDAERYPEGDLFEEKGLHGKKSKDDSDAETKLGICVEGEEKDKLAGMDVSFAEASPADESELLTATYYSGENLGLQDVAEEEEDVERLMEDRSAEAPSALASDVRRKRKLRQFLGMTHLSKRESTNNADTVQNVSLESERATPSVGVKRTEEDPAIYAPTLSFQHKNEHGLLISNSPDTEIPPPNLSSGQRSGSDEQTAVVNAFPPYVAEEANSSQKTSEYDKDPQHIGEAERTFSETAQFTNNGSDGASSADWNSQEGKAVRNKPSDISSTNDVYYDAYEDKYARKDIPLRQEDDGGIDGNLTCLDASSKRPRCKRKSKSSAEADLSTRIWAPNTYRRQLHSAPPDIDLKGLRGQNDANMEFQVSQFNHFTSLPAVKESSVYAYPPIPSESEPSGRTCWNPNSKNSWNKPSQSGNVSHGGRENYQNSTVDVGQSPQAFSVLKIQTNSQKTEEETEAVATNHAVEGEVRRFHRPESDRSHLDTPVGDNTIEGFVQEESNSRSGKGDSADISKTEKPAIIMRATEKSLEGLKGDIEGYTYSSDNEEMQSAFAPTVVFKRSQYQAIRDSQVASKVVLERPGQEADDPYSKVEDTLVTHDRLRKPHLTPQLKWNPRSDEQFTISQTEQPTKECTSQSVCEAEIGKSASKICKDPLMRPAEEGRNHYKPAELREVTSDAQKLILPLDLPTLLKKDRRSPTNDSELSSPLFSLPSNEEDCVRTDSALRDNQYDSDSVSLSELMSTEHLQLPVPTESIQLPAQSILPYDQMPGLSSADEAGRQMAESLKDAEMGNLRSTADRMQVVRREPTQTAPLFVAPRSHRMTAKTAYSQQRFQNVGLSPAQGKSDISDAEDVSNGKCYAHTGGVTEITPEGTISPSQPIQSTSMDYSIMKVYHEVGIYKRNICTQVDKHRIYCAADGEYFRDLKETLPHIKWQILKERCIGTSAYEPKKEDLSNIDSPVSLSAADSYGSEIYLLGGDLGEDDTISRVIETLKGLNAANQSDASTISSIIEALKAMRGGIQSAELFLSRLGFDMSTIIQKLQESKKY